MGEVPGRGGEGVFTLSVGFAASSPRGGAKGDKGGDGLPHQSALNYGMTATGSHYYFRFAARSTTGSQRQRYHSYSNFQLKKPGLPHIFAVVPVS